MCALCTPLQVSNANAHMELAGVRQAQSKLAGVVAKLAKNWWVVRGAPWKALGEGRELCLALQRWKGRYFNACQRLEVQLRGLRAPF